MNPLVNRPLPIAFGGPGAITVAGTRQSAGPPVAAAAVRHQPHDHLPVQLLPGPVIPQRRERLPALRAAVPAAREIPEHLKPGQVRVIPPPRPRPRTPLTPVPLPRSRPCPPSPAASPPPGGSGRDLSDDRPNSIRCRTARSARSFSSSASRSASRARSCASCSRSTALFSSSPSAISDSCRFASSAAASASPRTAPQHPPHPGPRQPQPPRSTANTLSSRKSRTTRQRVAARGPADASSPVTGFPNTYA